MPKRNVILLLCFIPFLLGIGVDLYVPSLPAMTAYFHTQAHWVQLTIGMYMLGYGVGQLILGILSDSTGRRPVLLICAVAFVLTSLLLANAANIVMLNGCRLLQGFAIAGLSVVGRAVAVDSFSGVELTKAISILSISWSLGPIIGPFIGGYLQHYVGWQANFYFYTVYGAGLLAFVYFCIVESIKTKHALHPKIIYTNIKVVLSNHRFLLGAGNVALMYGLIVVFNVVGPFLVQQVMGFSAVVYGYVALVFGVCYLFGNLVNRWLITRYKIHSILFVGIIIGVVDSAAMLLLGYGYHHITLLLLIAPISVLYFISAWIIPGSFALTLDLFPQQAGVANAVFGCFVALGVFLLSALVGSLQLFSLQGLAAIYLILCLIVLLFCWLIR